MLESEQSAGELRAKHHGRTHGLRGGQRIGSAIGEAIRSTRQQRGTLVSCGLERSKLEQWFHTPWM